MPRDCRTTILSSCVVSLIILALFSAGCISREEAGEPEYDLEGEVVMFLSDRPDIPFVTDSVIVTMDGRGTPNSWILQITAMEYPQPVDTFRFTVFGIDLMDTVFIASESSGGIAGLSRSGSKVFVSNVPGGGGRVVLTEYNYWDRRIKGEFCFTLVNVISGETIDIFDGYFDTRVDSTAF